MSDECEMIYKQIKGYEGLYMITNNGLVWSIMSCKFLRCVNDKGYYLVNLSKNNITKNHRIHKLVAGAFLENPENKPQIDHINRCTTDNNVSNLRYVTISENAMNKSCSKNKKLQIKGVYKVLNIFRAQIEKDGKRIQKNFKTLEECIAWRKQKEKELHGEYACKN